MPNCLRAVEADCWTTGNRIETRLTLPMLDFTSALYLGMRHAHETLQPWAQLTTGRPAALEPLPEAESVARALARLWRCERATLGPSTLHLFWDLFDVLARNRIAVYVDAGIYPIARWGVERAAAKGVPTATFRTHDPTALEAILHRYRGLGRRPVVVTDGLCPATGRTAPLPQYLKLVRAQDGYLVVDDTQALGILGRDPGRTAPYGRGGAGTLAWRGIDGPELIVGSSLAKGFGAPLAALAGDARVISTFEDLSSTRIHCSPPSLAAIAAASRALAVNERRGRLSAPASRAPRALLPGRIAPDRPLCVGRFVSCSNAEGDPGRKSRAPISAVAEFRRQSRFGPGAQHARRSPRFSYHRFTQSIRHPRLRGRIATCVLGPAP